MNEMTGEPDVPIPDEPMRSDEEAPADLRAQVVYWRTNYRILLRILAAQHEDPALAWLDEIVHTRFSKLL